jgi:AcrR family transcriptional regulator
MSPTAVADRSLEGRIVEAMLECIGRWGIAKTTAEDIARSAGISRATLYRVFPGGKDVAFDALLRHESARFFEAISEPLAHAATLEETLVVGLVEAARFVRSHEPLQYLLTHEPERVVPSFSFQRLDRAFEVAAAFTAPHLRPFVADDQAAAAGADWLVRQFFSYVLIPTPSFVFTDEGDVRRYVRTFLLPALTSQEL